MRNKKWLRYGLATTVLSFGAFGGILIACGDDDSGVTANTPDASNDNNTGGDTNNNPDVNNPDGDKPETSTPKPANIYVVHAATDYGPGNPNGMVRVCYATKAATAADFGISPLPPLPSSVADGSALPIPGIPIGTGGPFPSTGVPLEGLSIRPYVISAAALAGRGVVGETGLATVARCPFLLGPDAGVPGDGGFANDAGPLVQNNDYWQLADIPAGTFKNGKTYILGIFGCTGNVDGTAVTAFGGKCGPTLNGSGPYAPNGTPGPGNLKVVVMELDTTTTVAAGEMGIQFAHLSPQVEAAKGNLTSAPFTPVTYNGLDGGPDASTKKFVSADGGEQEITFNPNATTATTMVKVTGIVSSQGYLAANDDINAGAGIIFVSLPMNNSVGKQPSIQYLSEGKTIPNSAEAYVNGKAYTFVLVGDQDPPNAATAGVGAARKVHFIGFPNQFPQ